MIILKKKNRIIVHENCSVLILPPIFCNVKYITFQNRYFLFKTRINNFTRMSRICFNSNPVQSKELVKSEKQDIPNH